jgi:hypothetical protein
LILMDSQTGVRMLVDRAFQSICHFPALAYEITYTSSAVGMVRAGSDVAFLPSAALEISHLGARLAAGASSRAIVGVQRSRRQFPLRRRSSATRWSKSY